MKKKTISNKLNYSAIFEEASEGGYNVFFPSFPGCVTFGKTFEEAKIKAVEVLELWLEELAVSKEPAPSAKRYPVFGEVTVTVPRTLTFV